MKILLHLCCANCGIYPFEQLKEKGHEVLGYFFNPNIHPYQEYQKRLEALKQYWEKSGLEVVYRDEYLLEDFSDARRNLEERCHIAIRIPARSHSPGGKEERIQPIFHDPSSERPSESSID